MARIGINPLTWTNDDMPELGAETPLETCLNEAKQAGYDGMELGNKFPKTGPELKAKLAGFGLVLATMGILNVAHGTYATFGALAALSSIRFDDKPSKKPGTLAEAVAQRTGELAALKAIGRLMLEEQIVMGFHQLPAMFARLFEQGAKAGRQVCKID